jgi:hypothetical protein
VDNIIASVGVGEKFFQAGRAIAILPIRLGRFMVRHGLGTSVVCRLSIRKQTSFMETTISAPQKSRRPNLIFFP